VLGAEEGESSKDERLVVASSSTVVVGSALTGGAAETDVERGVVFADFGGIFFAVCDHVARKDMDLKQRYSR